MGPNSYCVLNFHGSFLKKYKLWLPLQDCEGQSPICILRGPHVMVIADSDFRGRFPTSSVLPHLSLVCVQQHKGPFLPQTKNVPSLFLSSERTQSEGCLDKCVSQFESSPGNLSKMHILKLHPRPTKWEILGMWQTQ